MLDIQEWYLGRLLSFCFCAYCISLSLSFDHSWSQDQLSQVNSPPAFPLHFRLLFHNLLFLNAALRADLYSTPDTRARVSHTTMEGSFTSPPPAQTPASMVSFPQARTERCLSQRALLNSSVVQQHSSAVQPLLTTASWQLRTIIALS